MSWWAVTGVQGFPSSFAVRCPWTWALGKVICRRTGGSLDKPEKTNKILQLAHNNQSINRSINQFIIHSISQSINQSIEHHPSIERSSDQSINRSINQSINQSYIRTVNQSINRTSSINRTIKRSVNQSINQSNQSINQSTDLTIYRTGIHNEEYSHCWVALCNLCTVSYRHAGLPRQ